VDEPHSTQGRNASTEAESALVASAQRGDLRARERIVLEYQSMVYNLGLRLTRDRDDAAVVLQETFLKVFKALPRFRSGSRLKTWIYRIATNEALQRIRRERERNFVEIDDLEADPERDLSFAARSLQENPHDLLENRELRDRLEAAIGELPPKHRAAFVLVDIEGLPLHDAAGFAGTTLPALKTNLRRARLFLRDRLASYLEERKDA
jgi:RNA polymerase sigma-70 factor (ECF subfamily)